MARRSRHEGSVHQVDGRWVAAIELPRTGDGKRVRRRRMASTKTEAQRLLREMQQELASKGKLQDSRRTVSEAIDDYRAAQRGSEAAAATVVRKEWMLAAIEEGLGSKRVASLGVADCDRFLELLAEGQERPNGAQRKPLTKGAVRRVRSTLVAVLRNDLRLGVLNRNVADLSVLPAAPVRSSERRALTRVELRKLLELGTGAVGVLVDLSGRNGLRPQEARAVLWENVDLDDRTLRVTGQMNAAGELVPPKTKKSARTIGLDRATAVRLKAWQAQQVELVEAARGLWQERGLVLTTSAGTAIRAENLRRSLHGLCDRAGLDRVTPYELRHTAITFQAERGYSAWEIADWAGTSERMVYDVYRHKLGGVVAVEPVDLDDEA